MHNDNIIKGLGNGGYKCNSRGDGYPTYGGYYNPGCYLNLTTSNFDIMRYTRGDGYIEQYHVGGYSKPLNNFNHLSLILI